MAHTLDWLEGDDLRSDGAANQAAEAVLKQETLLPDLIGGLTRPQDALRGRTADALEKIARTRPSLVLPYQALFIEILKKDSVAMVRMHLAMLLGHLAFIEKTIPSSKIALLAALHDQSAFVKSWAISSLCIIARLQPRHSGEIIQKLSELKENASIAVRTRVRKALQALLDPNAEFPKGWNKSSQIKLYP